MPHRGVHLSNTLVDGNWAALTDCLSLFHRCKFTNVAFYAQMTKYGHEDTRRDSESARLLSRCLSFPPSRSHVALSRCSLRDFRPTMSQLSMNSPKNRPPRFN